MTTKLIACVALCSILAIANCITAEKLPPGVPHTVWPDGSVFVEPTFTTTEYQKEAFKLVLLEANRIAKELHLAEKLPITDADVKAQYIAPFGYAWTEKAIGNITTKSYWYNIRQENKFSDLSIADYDQTCLQYQQRDKKPIKTMDTGAAYQLATQWLVAVSVDVKSLNRDCEARVAPTPVWNGVKKLGDMPTGPNFVPIYYVWWTSKENRSNGYGCVASVELFLPTKKLLQLHTYDGKYLLRSPVKFKDLASLFPKTNAPVTVVTNWPAPKTVAPPPPN